MRILFIGDVVGAAGMTVVKWMLPDAISRWEVDLAVVNGENSAGAGFGITEDTYRGIRGAGADVVTLGNHSWNRKEALSWLCQSNGRSSARGATRPSSSDIKPRGRPLGQCGGASLLV